MSNDSTCPYLGIIRDQNTSAIYPSRGNYCHRVRHPQHIRLTHQAQYCLTNEHKQCPVYAGEKSELPADIAWHRIKKKKKKRNSWKIGIGIALLLLIGGSLSLWFIFAPKSSELSEGGTPTRRAYYVTSTPSPTLTITPSRTIPSSPTPTYTPSPTFTPTMTRTPFPDSGPGLKTPFGPDNQYLIYSVRPGDGFLSLENQFRTSTEVILALNNFSENARLKPGMKLVLVPGLVDPADLPKFEVVFLDQDMDLIEIAGMYSSSMEDIRYYNALGDSAESIPAGRWLIVPIE